MSGVNFDVRARLRQESRDGGEDPDAVGAGHDEPPRHGLRSARALVSGSTWAIEATVAD